MNLKKLIELYRKDPSKWKDNLKGGLSDKKTPKDFNPKALEEGAKVEVEHVSDPKLALEISTDHLTENPNYYKELKRIEKGLKGDWKKEGYTIKMHGDDPDDLSVRAYDHSGKPVAQALIDHIDNNHIDNTIKSNWKSLRDKANSTKSEDL